MPGLAWRSHARSSRRTRGASTAIRPRAGPPSAWCFRCVAQRDVERYAEALGAVVEVEGAAAALGDGLDDRQAQAAPGAVGVAPEAPGQVLEMLGGLGVGETHPAVIRALADIASRLKRIGTPFSICGELAGDPAAAVLLLAMGFDAISVSPNRLLKVKSLIRFVDMPQARRILDAVLKLDHSQDIKEYLQRNLDQVGITPLFKEQSNTQSRLS